MPRDWLILQKAGADSASASSRWLLQHSYLGFRFLRYQCSLCLVLTTTPLKLLCASEAERLRLQVRYFRAIYRINFVAVYELLNDLFW